MTLAPGLEAAFGDTVIEADTAAALGSGEVPVLTTPQVLALAEQATVAAIAGGLEPGGPVHPLPERDRRQHLDLPGRVPPGGPGAGRSSGART
jgi:hypothetical protein